MVAICKRALRACFRTPVGGIFTAALLLVSGALAFIYNFSGGLSRLEYVLLGAQYALIVLIPFLVLAARVNEMRGREDLLLRTLPLSRSAVVWGRYLAHVAVLALPCAVLALYPLIYSLYGKINYAGAYAALASFFLLGCLLVAVCRFIVTVCRRLWLAALICVAAVLLLYFLPDLAYLIPDAPVASLIALAVASAALAGGVWARTRHPLLAAIVAAALILPTAVWYVLSPESFEGLATSVLVYLSPFMHFQQVAAYNFFDLSGVVALVSMTALFVVLTVWATPRVPRPFVRRPIRLTPTVRHAAAVGLASVLLLAAVNVGVWNLPAKYSLFDTSGLGITELTDESRRFVREIDEDVTIYWVCADGVIDNTQSLLLTRYAEENDRLRVTILDPVADADVVARYVDGEATNNSLIIASDRRAKVLERVELYYYTNSQLDPDETYRFTFSELSYYVSYYISLYGQEVESILGNATRSYFNGEAVLTSALDYVTADTVPQGYILTGHGANTPSETLLALWENAEITPAELDLREADAVPDNVSCLILFAPTEDLTEREDALIRDYLAQGGSFLLVTSPACVTRCPRAMALGAEFGMAAERGTVADASAGGHYGDSFYYISPTLNNQHGITYSLSAGGFGACMPNAHAITATQASDATVTPLMTTSESGQLMVEGIGAGTRGTLCLAATSARTVRTDGGQKTATAMFTWFGSADAFTDAVNIASKEGNYNYLTTAILWMSQPFESRFSTLPADCIDVPYLSLTSEGVALLWGVILAGVLPAAALTCGLVVWSRRRKR